MNAFLVKWLAALNAIIAWLIILAATAVAVVAFSASQPASLIIGPLAGVVVAVLINGLLALLIQIEVNSRSAAESLKLIEAKLTAEPVLLQASLGLTAKPKAIMADHWKP